jgi:hypothetical protein
MSSTTISYETEQAYVSVAVDVVVNVEEKPNIIQEEAKSSVPHVPKWQILKSFFSAMPVLHKVDEYISVYELLQGHPDLPYPTEQDSRYLRIFKTYSQDGHNLEAKLREVPEAVTSTFLLWGIEHFSQPERYPEIYVADRELMFTKYGDILTPFISYHLDRGGSVNVVCGPKVLHGQHNPLFRLFDQRNGNLHVLYYTSEQDAIFPDAFGECRYAIADVDVYYEITDPNDRLGNPLLSTAIKRSFYTRGGFVEDYRDIVRNEKLDRILLTRENYNIHLPRILPLTT